MGTRMFTLQINPITALADFSIIMNLFLFVAIFLANFLPLTYCRSSSNNGTTIPSHDVALFMLAKSQNDSKQNNDLLQKALKKRAILEEMIQKVVNKLIQGPIARQEILLKHPQQIGDMDCHDESPYALKYAYVLTNLCARVELNAEQIKMVLKEQCVKVKINGVI
ncbi:hypothetical protein niasHT_010445 [Heterodera trifolii]|uniref:Uncharacterized protein n=1 Tax=Heterodera trifolii TaxID=157864 RepID=A0ABD2MAR4_9BILA